MQLSNRLALQFSDGVTAKKELAQAIKKRGYFGTSPDGEQGLQLFLDGFPVLRTDGKPYTLGWDELGRAGVADAELKRAQRVQPRQRAFGDVD